MQELSKLVIAAHPDDEVLGCGGLISSSKNCSVLILTQGKYDFLFEQSLKANKILGSKKVYFANLPNQRLDYIPITNVAEVIEKYISVVKPSIVFTHNENDLNKDHRIVYQATMIAVRPLPNQMVREVYSYFVASSTEWGKFEPNYYLDIEDKIQIKIKAMKCYQSECRKYPHPRSPQALRVYSHYWGLTVGMGFVEPFKLIRKIER